MLIFRWMFELWMCVWQTWRYAKKVIETLVCANRLRMSTSNKEK